MSTEMKENSEEEFSEKNSALISQDEIREHKVSDDQIDDKKVKF